MAGSRHAALLPQFPLSARLIDVDGPEPPSVTVIGAAVQLTGCGHWRAGVD
ncbi:hypothetical protein [Puniceibacterium confluentis]|uniref:hypothetical protein n=1 Tax=Puniceibacterium confluentis TaxID=1958944 RepID=UPI001648DCE6|nr:hypothetical protein [Puniceibacterium confluentis]